MVTSMQRDALGQVIGDMNQDKENRQTGEALWASTLSSGSFPRNDLAAQDRMGAQVLADARLWSNEELGQRMQQALETAMMVIESRSQAIDDSLNNTAYAGLDMSGMEVVRGRNEEAQKLIKEAQEKAEDIEAKRSNAMSAIEVTHKNGAELKALMEQRDADLKSLAEGTYVGMSDYSDGARNAAEEAQKRRDEQLAFLEDQKPTSSITDDAELKARQEAVARINQEYTTKMDSVINNEYMQQVDQVDVSEFSQDAQAKLGELKAKRVEELVKLEEQKPTSSITDDTELKARQEDIQRIEQEYKREMRKTIEAEYRQEMMQNMEGLREGVQTSQLAEAERRVAEGTLRGEDVNGPEAEVALFTKVKSEDMTAEKQVNGGAKDYMERVGKGEEARESLRQNSLEAFIETIKPEVNEQFQERINAIKKANPMGGREDEIGDIERERDKLIGRLEDKGNSLAGQMKFVVDQMERNDNLGEKEKRELRGKMLQEAAQYEGNPDRFATEFFKKNQPDMAAVSLADLARSGGLNKNGDEVSLNPKEVFNIAFKEVNGKKAIVLTETGAGNTGNEIVIDNPETVKRAMENGVDLQGMRKDLFVRVDTAMQLSEENQLKLVGTKDHNIRLAPTNGGRRADTPEDYQNLTASIENVVSVGDNDKGFDNNRTVRAYSMEVAGMERAAKRMEALAKRAEEAQSKMAAAEKRAMNALPPDVLAALQGERARMGGGFTMANANEGETQTPNGPGGQGQSQGRTV
jgi:hypothetical protein